jgi:hypothetical protein
MEVYKITYKNLEQQDEFEGVYAISLVEDPANEMQFIMLSNTKKDVLKLANKEKQLLTGVVLMPNQKIYRRDDSGKEYEIFFEADVIEKLSQDFLKNGFQKNSTYNHNENNWLQDISVVEQWIIEDPENDKANALGFKELPKGTWMVTFKVSDEVWGDYVKTGKVKGFSIDAFLDMEKIKMNNNKTKKRKKMSLLTKLRNLIATTLMKEIEIEGMGKLLSENFEIGDEVFSGNELVISSSFTYEGFVYMTDEDGVIVSKDEFVEDMPAEEAEMVAPEEEVEMEEVTEEEVVEIVDIAESIAEQVVEEGEVNVEVLQEMVSFLEEKVDALEVENADLKSQLSKKPNTQKLSAVSNVSNISESKMEKIARLAKLGQK